MFIILVVVRLVHVISSLEYLTLTAAHIVPHATGILMVAETSFPIQSFNAIDSAPSQILAKTSTPETHEANHVERSVGVFNIQV